MRIAPHARPDDGAFDIVVVKALPKGRLLANLPSLYRGTHLLHPDVDHMRGMRVEAHAALGEVWLDIDGEALGTLPASIEVLPSAITLIGVGSGGA